MTAPQRTFSDINAPAARAGLLIGVVNKEISCTLTGALKQIVTMTVNAAADEVNYTYQSVDDLGVSTEIVFNSGSGATVGSIATGIALANNGNGIIGAYQSAESAAAVVTFTANRPNTSFSITESDARLDTPVVTQVAAAAASLAMGLGVVRKAEGSCGAANTTDLTLQVTRITPVAQNGVNYTTTITMDDTGDVFSSDFLSVDADLGNIVTGITASIASSMPSDTVDEDGSSGTFIDLTSELPGISYTVSLTTSGAAGVAEFTAVTTTGSGADKFLGASRHSLFGEQTSTGGDFVYPGSTLAPILQKGGLWVRLDAGITVALDDAVYVRHTATGSELLGAFRTDRDTADAFRVFGVRWRSANKTGFDGHNIAALELNLATL